MSRLVWITLVITLAALVAISYPDGFYSSFDVTGSDDTLVRLNRE